MGTRKLIGRIAGLAALLFAAPALAQPPVAPPALVACGAAPTPTPCSQVATSPADIVGVWKQFLGNPALAAPDGMGYIRYFADGRFNVADTPANTARPYAGYPTGRVSFSGDRMLITLAGEMPMPECNASPTYQVQVLRVGQQPVALVYTPVDDECGPRLADLRHPLIWVAPAVQGSTQDSRLQAHREGGSRPSVG